MALTAIEKSKIRQLLDDPVLWAKTFIISNNAITKKYGAWEARDYQEEMMRDKSLKKVYRCGRRTGKTDTMVVEGLHKTFTKKNFRALYVTPYESQIRLIFIRIKEIISDSPLLRNEIESIKMNPYMLKWKNGSIIMGFTTGASTGSGAASVRGQRGDWIFLDEMDYLGAGDYDTVSMIAAERSDIGMTVSSTPTGKRGKFYDLCTNKALGYSEHYHPSMHNPSWNDDMESHFRAELTSSAYDHEVLAIFGVEEAGVFNKDKLDIAFSTDYYAYDPLSNIQMRKAREMNISPSMYIFNGKRAPGNVFRTMGIDWDKYGASSSIVILDFDVILQKFRVILRLEVPRTEYSYDNAVNTIVELNDKYNPTWIYADRGSGEYQIERLHIIGDENPFSNLKSKLVGWSFKNTVEIIDPITRMKEKKPMKPFMVNQLTIAFERERMICSPYDEVMNKQLTDYVVERVGQNGDPVFTDINEHSVDALGLAYLAFVLQFSELTDQIKQPKFTSKIIISNAGLGQERAKSAIKQMESKSFGSNRLLDKIDTSELKGERANWVKLPLGAPISASGGGGSWGSRGGFSNRSSW